MNEVCISSKSQTLRKLNSRKMVMTVQTYMTTNSNMTSISPWKEPRDLKVGKGFRREGRRLQFETRIEKLAIIAGAKYSGNDSCCRHFGNSFRIFIFCPL